ncbi:hypothetical protein N9V13_01320 [Betaproteobacteria bacterium]|nr:hypothetical protein [Betaproteobacteria bacterium]
MFNWFKKIFVSYEKILSSNNTDNFADTLLVELKASSTSAITNAVNKIEGKYMKSVLEESYFPLQSLTFVPNDIEVARTLEEFFRVHEDINPDFRKVFCKSFLQKEYFSDRGAKVIIDDEFVPIFKIDVSSLEEKSEDEKYLISIRGRKILFSSHANLGNPKKSYRKGDSHLNINAKSELNKIKNEVVVKLLISDKDGHRSEDVTLPTLIGKNPDNACIDFGITPIYIRAKYVSRHQIFIYSILDKMFYIVPDEATLTCRNGEGEILEHGKNYSIKRSGERLYLGVPPENSRPLTANVNPAEFPVLEIQPFSHEGRAVADKTPRPTVV